MKREFEFRDAKGFCRLCGYTSHDKMVVIPAKMSGKHLSIILCQECITYLKAHIETDKENTQ